MMLPVTPDMRKRARVRSDDMGAIRNSFLEGKGNFAGFLGEYLVLQYLYGDNFPQPVDTFCYDIDFHGYKLEVKTKQTRSVPRPHYECSVPETSSHQHPDLYVFTRVHKDFTHGWVLGFLWYKEFTRKAKLVRSGDRDKSNDWTCTASCKSVAISELNSMDRMKLWLEQKGYTKEVE